MKLKKHETIVTAWPTFESGPGWSNTPVWVIINDGNGVLREECIQPEDQTREVVSLFNSCNAVHSAFLRAVRKAVMK